MSNVEEQAIREYMEQCRQQAEERAARSVRSVQKLLGIETQPTPEGYARIDNLLFRMSADYTMHVRRDDWAEGVWRVVEDWASLGGALSTVPEPAMGDPVPLVLERIASVLERIADSMLVKVNRNGNA